MPEERKRMTVEEAGRKGGETTKNRYGPEFYREIGGKGGETTANRYGREFYQEIGKNGGEARAEKLTPNELSEIGRRGGAAPHPHGRGLQNVDSDRREEIARLGGESSHKPKEDLEE